MLGEQEEMENRVQLLSTNEGDLQYHNAAVHSNNLLTGLSEDIRGKKATCISRVLKKSG